MDLFQILGKIAIQNSDANRSIDETSDRARGASDEVRKFGDEGDKTESKLSKAFSKIGSAAVKIGKAVGTGMVAAGAGIIAIGKQAVDSYGDYEQLVGGAQLMFGDAYSYIADKAKNAYSEVQMSQNDYLRQVNGFATGLKTSLGGNEKAAAILADKIITAEADIVAATGNTQENIQNAFNGIMKGNYTMLDNLQIGIKPTKEGMQEVIDKVNQYNAAHGNATKYTIDNLADCESAIVDYVAMVGMQGYAHREATQTIQGSVSATKAAWKNLVTGLMDENANVGELTSNLISSSMMVVDAVMPKIKQFSESLPKAIETAAPKLLSAASGLISSLLPVVVNGATSVLNAAVSVLPQITQTLLSNIPILIDGLLSVADSIISALPQVMSAITSALPTLLPQLIDGIVSLFLMLVNALPGLIEPLISALPSILMAVVNALLNNLPTLIDGVIQLVLGIVGATDKIITTLVPMIPEIMMQIVAALIRAIPTLLSGVWQLIQAIPKLVKDWYASWLSGWGRALGKIISKLAEFFANIGNSIKTKLNAIKSAVTTAFNAVKSAIEKPINAAKDIVKKGLDAIRGFFDKLKLKFPNIKLPHFKVEGKLSISPPSVPKLSIQWYKKAYDNPVMLNNPTIFGYNPATGSFMGGGDGNGAEIVSGANTLMNMIKLAIQNENATLMYYLDRLINMLADFFPELIAAAGHDIIADDGTILAHYGPGMDRELGKIKKKKERGS